MPLRPLREEFLDTTILQCGSDQCEIPHTELGPRTRLARHQSIPSSTARMARVTRLVAPSFSISALTWYLTVETER